MKMKPKLTKSLAMLLMLCMLLPRTALAATTYYLEVSISGPDAENITQTVSASSSRSAATSVTTRTDGTTVESTTSTSTTVTRDPSTGTVTETVTSKTVASDGVKSEGRTVTEIRKDGTVTSRETVNASNANGTTASKVTTTDPKNGTVTRAEAHVSWKDVTESDENHQPVQIPVAVSAAKEQDNAPRSR